MNDNFQNIIGDNEWIYCAQCEAEDDETIEKMQQALDDLYGVVKLEEFKAAEQELADFIRGTEQREQTVKVNFELTENDGDLVVDISKRCTRCNHYAEVSERVEDFFLRR